MTSAFLKSAGQICCRMLPSFGVSGMFSRLDGGYAFHQYGVSIDSLVKAMSTKLLHCEVTFLPL